MVATVAGRSGLALLFSGSIEDRPTYCAIGSGSGTVSVNNTTLVYEFDRNAFTLTDSSVIKHVTYTCDFNSIEMSGNVLREFGIVSSGNTMSGTLWNREGFTGVTFDGSNELQIQVDFEIF